MGKNLLKKASVALLAVMMSLALMPIKGVHAISWLLSNLKEGDLLKPGDIFDPSYENNKIAEFIYTYVSNSGTSTIASAQGTNEPYEVVDGSKFGGTYSTIHLWEVTSITNTGNGYKVTVKNFKPRATIETVKVVGVVDKEIKSASFKIKTNVTINTNVDTDITSWFTNIPDGLKATISGKEEKNKTIIVKMTGKATDTFDEVIELTIPGSAIKESDNDLYAVTNYSAKYVISNPSATIDNVEIVGTQGTELLKIITVRVTDDKFKLLSVMAAGSAKTNLPDGLTASYEGLDNGSVVVKVTGTPTASGEGVLSFTIPGKWLESGIDLKVTANPNAKFNIKADSVNITIGEGSSHKIGTDGHLKFVCSGKLNDLVGIYVDNVLVNKSNYTLQSGSTILTLKAAYLNTLKTGKHTLKFQYKNNLSASTNFTITKEGNNESPTNSNKSGSKGPQTADMSPIAFYLLLTMGSGLAGVFVLKRKKEQI